MQKNYLIKFVSINKKKFDLRLFLVFLLPHFSFSKYVYIIHTLPFSKKEKENFSYHTRGVVLRAGHGARAHVRAVVEIGGIEPEAARKQHGRQGKGRKHETLHWHILGLGLPGETPRLAASVTGR